MCCRWIFRVSIRIRTQESGLSSWHICGRRMSMSAWSWHWSSDQSEACIQVTWSLPTNQRHFVCLNLFWSWSLRFYDRACGEGREISEYVMKHNHDKYLPLIGRKWSHDLDTCLSLVESYHMTQTMASDRSRAKSASRGLGQIFSSRERKIFFRF